MFNGVTETAELPRLLDLANPPQPTRLRWYWRYIRRWRRRLFHLWCEQTIKPDEAAIANALDDLLAIFFLMAYLRRMGLQKIPTAQEAFQMATRPFVSGIAEVVLQKLPHPIVEAVFQPDEYDNSIRIPDCLFYDNWEKRIENAIWLLYGNHGLPLSFFGDFHQVCVGDPLSVQGMGDSQHGMRRVRGMYYTPSPIVDYLVSTTLGQALVDRHPDELWQFRLLDPSCGCGAFLIGCLRYLFRWVERRLDCGVEESTQTSLAIAEHMFHGCDIDSRAVRWTIRMLLLTAWENLVSRCHDANVVYSMLIPDFRNAIRCKSFLDQTPADDGKFSPVNFDIIIGGPPFVRFEQLRQSQNGQLPTFRRNYLSARHGQFDLYMLFIERGIDLLKEDGRLAFTLSNSFLRTATGRTVRGYIAANACVEEFVEFSDPRTYADAATQIVLLRLRKTRQRFNGRHVLVKGRGNLRRKFDWLVSDRPHPDIAITNLQPKATASSCWQLTASEDSSWLGQIYQAGVPLGHVVKMAYGSSTGLDGVLLFRQVARSSSENAFVQARDSTQTIQLEKAAMRYIVRGRHIRGWRPPTLRYLHPFPYDANGDILSEFNLRTQFPLLYAYLISHQTELAKRSLSRGCRWFSTFGSQQQLDSQGPRLISAKIIATGNFTLIDDPCIHAHNSVVVISPKIDEVDIYYLLGILNSQVFGRYVSLTMPPINTGRYSLRLSRLRLFPVPNPQLEKNRVACMHIASLVRDLTYIPVGRPVPQDVVADIENHVARLYKASAKE